MNLMLSSDCVHNSCGVLEREQLAGNVLVVDGCGAVIPINAVCIGIGPMPVRLDILKETCDLVVGNLLLPPETRNDLALLIVEVAG